NADKFKKGGVVVDTCGVKRAIVYDCEEVLNKNGVQFIGGHPMAGREFSGFEYSVDNLFERASFIITETSKTPTQLVATVGNLAYEIGFRKVVVSTPEEHDRVVAFTSQLAHIVSNAYVKSPSLTKHSEFSAGSFKDLTRVAKLNEEMWTSLFMLNKEPLIEEISHIISSLDEYKKALEDNDRDMLKQLLKNGRELKELSNNFMMNK
ncbi:MAG: prephenate dehydrogenase/arogenate dehydrogenase family protein, partial [Clostridiales bacterium]|nr:prephenate dehydrogenase/arogenate dehydrogenase family protein [Clostridiales bacterium]